MSKIDKLSILGIRSFDNARSETIQFYTPLTLIVGYNGSGKTTIIECLKYATTGELPPNSARGGAFIHDPKLCGEREVLAQVRLAFVSTTQARMVATRNIQLQVKKTTRTQKTLEGQLLMVKDGERTSVSTRVAELDQMLPQFLGVSKAVLENVVFCHQEESLWPLSEPAALKKKFDEIFEALRYTKAIDNIKQLRKKQNEELGKFKLVEQHAKENKDRADKAVRRSQELQDEIEGLRTEHKDLDGQAAAAGDRAQQAWNNVARFTEIVESLRMARRNSEFYGEQVRDLEQDLQVLPDSDDWLASELAQFEERVRAQEARRGEQRKRYDQVQQEVEQTRSKHSTKRMEAGRHEQAKITHESRVKDRGAAIRKAAGDHGIRGYDMELDDMQISEFMDRIAKLSKEQNIRIDRLRRENAAEVQKIQDVLDELRERRTTLTENRRAAKERIDISDRKIQSAHTEMLKLSIDEAGRANLNANIEEINGKLAKSRQSLKGHEADGKLREANKTLQGLEDDSALLNKKLIDTSKQAAERGRLEHLKREANERQRSLETIRGAHGTRISNLIGHNWSEASLEKDYEALITSKKQNVAEAQRQRDGVAQELQQVEYKLKTARADLKKKREEAEANASEVREVIQDEPSEYLEVIDDAEKNRDQLKSDVEGFVHMQDYFSKAVEVAQSNHPACRLCQRAFNDAEAARQFANRLIKQSSQRQLEECRQGLKQWEDDLRKYRNIGPSYEAWKRVTEKDIPNTQADISRNEELRKSVLERLENHDLTVRNLEDQSRDADGLFKPIGTITKCRSELKEFQEQIRQLSQQYGGDQEFASLEELQEKMATADTKLKDQRQKVAKLQADEQSQKAQINGFEMDLNAARSKLVTADHELEKKAAIVSQIEELKSSNQDQRDIMATIDVEMQELGPRWSEETTRRDDYKQQAEAREGDVQREATTLMDDLRELHRVNNEARRYSDEGGPAHLAQCQREIQTLEQQLATLNTEVKQITVEINKVQEELSSQDKKKRVISDNIKHREARRKLAAGQEEIERLSAHNAEADQQQHRKDAEHFQKEHQQLLAQATSKVERMKVKDDQLKQLIDDWNTEYKDAAPGYKKAHIQVETTKAAVEDLGRYGAALDKAIMKYHGLKMEEINRIIEELWRRTYQGTDVDTILIRSDNETQKGNRSYNYRVCMVKQDAEMDMRGRCSAGQKVLASIIIRLALAECFGVNCGLIALDEPTTNLDRDNIGSLAEALNHIIRQRRQQKNFQLIVITHDEDFLRAIKPQEFCDHYYRISRNDRQKSIIERQNIAAVM